MSADQPSCPVWNPSGCTGTAGCPPRCPRFVDKRGTPILVTPDGEAAFDALASFSNSQKLLRNLGEMK